jgi:hypothetical protein
MNKLIEQAEERQKLYDLVCNLSGEDIKEYTRLQEVVYARIVFSNILLDELHKERDIANFLGFDRSNIYHYRKVFSSVISSSKYAKELYKKSKRYFYKNITFNEEKAVDFDKLEISKELFEIKKEYNKLQKEYEKLNSKLTADIDLDRFYETFKAITLNVKKGKEELLAKKIFNTINTVNSSIIC